MSFQFKSRTVAGNSRPLFGGGVSSTGSGAVSGEIDLRAELDELFFGYQSGKRHGYPVIIRSMRRDANNRRVECTCKDAITREPDFDCSYCFGEGFLCDEIWTWTYSMYSGSEGGLTRRIKYQPPGAIRVDYKVFFFRYDTPIKYGDKIVEAKLDEEGNQVIPLTRESIYEPQTLNKLRADNSRVEYITVYCKENDAIRMDNI
jgi:hypothetical protein